MSADRPICLLLGALGGQGGGLLAEWLSEAARIAGYPAQATSIPGVAQRTGATTYYFELYPQQIPPDDVVFSLFPSSGDVDLLATLEPTEAGRAIEAGRVTRNTRVISATRRVYSTAEKSAAGDGRIDPLPLLAALRQIASELHLIDPDASALPLNARLLGAIAASDTLPLEQGHYRQAIEQSGVAVERNLAGFDDGLTRASAEPQPIDLLRYQPSPTGFDSDLALFPEALRPLLGHALARLVDYQDRAYAQHYLDRLKPLANAEPALLQESAQQLARWMSFEDILRVAQLKSRPDRLARIRRELGANDDQPVQVRDYFEPRMAELMALLPGDAIALRSPAPTGTTQHATNSGLALRWPSSSPLGFGLLRLLAGLRRFRRHGRGYRHEQAAIDRWLNAVTYTQGRDSELALLVARLAIWARGYGAVRESGLAQLDRLLGDWQQRFADDPVALTAELSDSLNSAQNDPDGAHCG